MTSSTSYSSEASYATALSTPVINSPVSETASEMQSTSSMDLPLAAQAITPGVYTILNDLNPDSAIDLSGYDMKTIIAYGSHQGENQKWAVERLGPGYSIKCLFNDSYITLDFGISDGNTMITTPYPVSWVIEPDDFEAGIYRIRWPNSPFVFDMPEATGHKIQLSNRYPFNPSRLWRFVRIQANEASQPKSSAPGTLKFETTAPRQLEATPLITTADTVIDAEGLKLGGNGEMSITTTTSTVTTTVTVVKRLGSP